MDTLQESVSQILGGMAKMSDGRQRPAQFITGTVLEASEGALRVFANGQELRAEDLWVNEALLPGWCPQLKGTLPGYGYHGGCSTPVEEHQLTRGKHALAKGDRVVLFTEDQQDYYLLCKAVRP